MSSPQSHDDGHLPLPGPRALWWLLGVLAVLLPAAAIVQSALAQPSGPSREVEFEVREQTLLWRASQFFTATPGHKSGAVRKHESTALPDEPTATNAWLTGRLGLPDAAGVTRALFEQAEASETAVGQAEARKHSRPLPRQTELVVAFAIATRQDAVAAELAARIRLPSEDLRAAMAALPAAPTATTVNPAVPRDTPAQASQAVRRHGFGTGWSPYLRDRVRARVHAAAGELALARPLITRLHEEDGRVAAFFAALVQVLSLAGLFGSAMLLAGLVRTGLAMSRGEPPLLWLRGRFPGLGALPATVTGMPHVESPVLGQGDAGLEPPYRTDPLVPLLGFGAWLLGFFLVAVLASQLPGVRMPNGFSILLQSGAGILIAQAVIHAFARGYPPLQVAARLGGNGPGFWASSTAALRAYCVLLPVMLILLLITALFAGGEGDMHPVAGFLLDDADPVQLTTIGIAVLVAAPFGEELLFRGFLYRVLRQRFGPMPALLTTALLFALLHVAPHALLPYIGLGLAFGLIYEGVGSLWASIILHSLWNAVVFARILVVAAS
jgi:membrane protease YdiL (CAAX protease family)